MKSEMKILLLAVSLKMLIFRMYKCMMKRMYKLQMRALNCIFFNTQFINKLMKKYFFRFRKVTNLSLNVFTKKITIF